VPAGGGRAGAPAGAAAAGVPAATRRLIVKVCGLTRLEDARAAAAAGADWLGFIVHGESPRRIDAARAGEIAAALRADEELAGRAPLGIVAVMVNPGPAVALELARAAGADRVQLHQADAATWPAGFPLPVIWSVPVTPQGRMTAPEPDPLHLMMLDTADAARAGGSGATFEWEGAATLIRRRAVLLAGGLGPDNVAEAIARVRPFGVDASSRLERAPGLKDHDRVRRFVAAARECDELDRHRA
jgi:phosphoribosylanthranilate isomerase